MCLIASTKLGDIVFDPFMGSGTTGVVAKTLNLSFYGVEKDNNYFQLAEQRIYNTLL